MPRKKEPETLADDPNLTPQINTEIAAIFSHVLWRVRGQWREFGGPDADVQRGFPYFVLMTMKHLGRLAGDTARQDWRRVIYHLVAVQALMLVGMIVFARQNGIDLDTVNVHEIERLRHDPEPEPLDVRDEGVDAA